MNSEEQIEFNMALEEALLAAQLRIKAKQVVNNSKRVARLVAIGLVAAATVVGVIVVAVAISADQSKPEEVESVKEEEVPQEVM